jgi:hypothetical protein
MSNISHKPRLASTVPTPEPGYITQFTDSVDNRPKYMDDTRAVFDYSGVGTAIYYRHDQPSASASWVINHGLGVNPNIKVYSVGSVEVLAAVTHTTLNQAVVSFEAPFAGFAVCS